MNRKLAWSLCIVALALCSLSAMADTLFTDLGPPGNVYNCCTGWTVSGTGTIGTSFTAANLFTVSGSGNFNVSQIDIGIGNVVSPNTFNASVWTDNNGLPGTQLAFFGNLTTNEIFGNCCGMTTISGISGLSLAGGQSYFLVIGPVNINDASWNAWNWNNQGVIGQDLFSNDGGQSWVDNGQQTLGAFDILGSQGQVPEPASLFLLGSGLVGALGTLRRKLSR